jgi:hypothetical protein
VLGAGAGVVAGGARVAGAEVEGAALVGAGAVPVGVVAAGAVVCPVAASAVPVAVAEVVEDRADAEDRAAGCDLACPEGAAALLVAGVATGTVGLFVCAGALRAKTVAKPTVASAPSWVTRQVSVRRRRNPASRDPSPRRPSPGHSSVG